VQDVPDDGDAPAGELVEAAESLAQGVEVKQCLRGVLAAAVAGVDDGRAGVACGQSCGTRGRMAEHDSVCPEAIQGHDRVYEGLALGDG
jgi:hypothetical protein